MTYGYFDNTWQMPSYNSGFDWSTWCTTTPYYGGYDYGFGYSSNPNSVVTEGSKSSKKEETTGDFLEKQKAHEKEVAQARIQAYAQKNMLENGLSQYTIQAKDAQGNPAFNEEGKPIMVYADANGNPLTFKLDEQGNVVFDEKGVPVQDPNGQMVPVEDKKNIEKQKQKVEAGKKADGSSVQSMSAAEYEKKVPWYKRAFRAVGNMVEGVWNMGKSLVGYGPDGKFDLLKLFKNAAIVVGGIALTVVCPAAGPVLLYSGLAMGAAQVGKGVYKACTAKTVEEIDTAWQDTGAGVATAAASVAGLRSMGRAAGASAFTPKGAGTIIRSHASKNAVTFKGGVPKWNNTQFKANFNEANPFTKAERNFKAASKQTSANTEARLQQIDNELARLDMTADGATAQKAILEAEKSGLNASRNIVTNAKTKVEFSELNTQGIAKTTSSLRDAKSALNRGESVEINGVTIESNAANINKVDAALKSAEDLTAQYNQLVAAKNSMMNSLMYRNANRLRKADNFARKYNRKFNKICGFNENKVVRLATKKMHTRAPQRAQYMKGAPKTNYSSKQFAKKLGGKGLKYGMKALIWEYEVYKAMPTAGQVYATADRTFATQHYEYGSMYDAVGGFADGLLATNSGAMYAPQTLDAAQTSQMIAAYDKEIATIQSKMNKLDSQIRQLA